MTFDDFFIVATGNHPFPFQSRLAITDDFPLFVDVPTGMGKTAAIILAWLWRRHAGDRTKTPRRLVYCLPMRTLVEQTQNETTAWVNNLVKAGVLAPAEVPSVNVLMGGMLEQEWDIHPELPAIIVGTQDQLLSRALNRGYAMSRYRWPLHFGLLNNDCLWVLDEVQLFGAGLATTAQLQAFREGLSTYGTASSVWMSATLEPSWLATVDYARKIHDAEPFQLGDDDRACQPIARRINARKTISRAATRLAKDTQGTYAKLLAREVLESHLPGTLTLFVANRVDRAREIFKALQKSVAMDENAPELVLIHSRFRPADRVRHTGRLLAPLPTSGRVVVATQVIEAGLDLDARVLFTELAPWSSLVQRFGRCNRRGDCPDAKVIWVDLDTAELPAEQLRPYEAEELEKARQLVQEQADVGPGTLPVVAQPARPGPVLRRCDLVDLFDTTADLSGNDLDVSRYIRDADNLDVHLYWRSWPDGKAPPAELPDAAANELCPVPAYSFRDFLSKATDVHAWRWNALDGGWEQVRPEQVVPGREYLLPVSAGGYDKELGWDRTCKSAVAEVPVAIAAADASGADLSSLRSWLSLEQHTDQVVQVLTAIAQALEIGDLPLAEVIGAARWHDAGKAHQLFQQFLCGHELERLHERIWAKSPCPLPRHIRPRFRHELASGIAALLNGQSDLVAYLAAAHHGKVRLSIRSLPGETVPDEPSQRFARGLWEGDILPEAGLGGGVTMPATAIDLEPMEMGDGKHGASWLARMTALREALGPFRLAFMEALVKAADERASSEVTHG